MGLSCKSCVLATLLICTSFNRAVEAQPHAVKTADGLISGTVGAQDGVTAFLGIPFAAPPVGDLRWRPPSPPSGWKGVRVADHLGSSCMQPIVKERLPWTEEFHEQNEVSEDCLYLNIWSPKVSPNAHLPVIVFIHGGGYTSGSGGIAVYNGSHLAAGGVVVITINYRLGVFGFLAHPELSAESSEHASGNYGLLDQIQALKWVRKNVRGFGGDPDRLTVWGQSAGAFSVGALIASPLTSGLFERAVADSGLGTAVYPFVMSSLEVAERGGVKFAAVHHATSIEELRADPAADLLPGPQDYPLAFMPIIDGYVLPYSPQEMSRRGKDNDIPIITGYQANDSMLLAPPIGSVEQYDTLAAKQYGELAPDFLALYPPTDLAQAREMQMRSSQDRDRVSMFLWAAHRLENHKSSIYTYFFDRAIPWPQHPQFGAFHTGEIPYLFKNLSVLDRPWEQTDRRVSLVASSYLIQFAQEGDPNGVNLPPWAPVNSEAKTVMEIGEEMQAMPIAADSHKIEFWMRFFSSPQAERAPAF